MKLKIVETTMLHLQGKPSTRIAHQVTTFEQIKRVWMEANNTVKIIGKSEGTHKLAVRLELGSTDVTLRIYEGLSAALGHTRNYRNAPMEECKLEIIRNEYGVNMAVVITARLTVAKN